MKAETARQALPRVKAWSDEWILLRFIRNWKPEIVREAVRRDVDLTCLMEEHPAQARIIRGLAGKHCDFLRGEGLAVDVMFWFSVRRPDIYRVLVEEPGGEAWIIRNVENMRKALTA